MIICASRVSHLALQKFRNQIPTMKLHKVRTVNCSADYPDVECNGYTAYDTAQKVIVISFRGTKGPNQNNQIVEGMTRDGLLPYFGNGSGKIFKVLYDSFMLLWNEWYSNKFPSSFHIIHRLDLIPRVPAIDPHTNTTVMFHPRTEVWYNNYMRLNDTYQICEEADGNNCSDAVTEGLNMNDHGFYFDINIANWGKDGCPKNTTGYSQP
uniref:Uncharacterized protein C40H1.2 n=1 Tax=Caenorhabditis elegans TaxID=6239 RepID=YLF2_CAEEL|nr:RecName: Full=Uncharacterized protein C40H1.2 [Caenorhabditis elegans]|eukprot:NP_499050.1 Uncharacterized protein CELE_C40H1.2 [Caenorhabditis elegans]